VGYNSVAIFIHLAVVASQICEIPRYFPKIRSIAVKIIHSEIIEGHRFCSQSKAHMQLPISH